MSRWMRSALRMIDLSVDSGRDSCVMNESIHENRKRFGITWPCLKDRVVSMCMLYSVHHIQHRQDTGCRMVD